MPLFDFECRTCGTRFERLVRSTDRDEDQVCPVCGKTDAKRLLSAPAALAADGGGRAPSGGGCGGFGRFT
jgi:putative FmdB family regulatory protein